MTLSLFPTSAMVGSVTTATLTGEVGGSAYVDMYAEPDAASCAPTSAEQDQRIASYYLDTIWLPAGPFSQSESVPAAHLGTYRVCAYLYDEYDDDTAPPRVLREATLTIMPPPPPQQQQESPPPQPPVVQPDTTPPTVALSVRKQRLRVVLAKGLKADVTTSEAGKVCVAVTVSRRVARTLGLRTARLTPGRARTYELGGACARVGAPGEQLMRVRLARPAVRALRKRVRRHRGVSVQVSATAHDGANNSASTLPKTIKLHA